MKQSVKKLCLSLIVVVGIFALAGCGGDDYASEINVYNWGDYIEPALIEKFEEEHNIKVNYEMFETNEEMYVKLAAGASTYDVIIPSDYMIDRLIKEDLLLELDMENIPAYGLIDEQFKNMPYDPDNKYSVPYMWGTIGIVYNESMVEAAPDGWEDLWDANYKGNIFMLNSQRDSIAIALKLLGHSLNTENSDELEEAKQLLLDQKQFIRAYVGDEVTQKMIDGEAALSVMWSGDGFFVQDENPDLQYVIPKEGTNYWVDAMVIPKTSDNKEGAETFINFMTETENALANVEYIQYCSPQVEVVDQLPEEVKGNPNMYPTEEALINSEVFSDLSKSLPVYDKIWSDVLSE